MSIRSEIFHEFLNHCFDTCVPQFKVLMSSSDKPWITPFVKFAIQKRWDAFRMKNFDAYRHWKEKANEAIIKAKQNWSRKASQSSRNLWRVVNSTLGTKSLNAMMKSSYAPIFHLLRQPASTLIVVLRAISQHKLPTSQTSNAKIFVQVHSLIGILSSQFKASKGNFFNWSRTKPQEAT